MFVARTPLLLTSTLLTLLAAPVLPHGGAFRGPATTLGPGGASKGGPSSTGGGFVDSDPAAWSQWWSFQRDGYLAVRDAVFSGEAATTGSDDFYLGKGGPQAHRSGLRPTEATLYDEIVPALVAALDGQKDVDIITGSLLALAKIGDRSTGEPGVAQWIRPWLAHGNQEVAETAAIALGVLGRSDDAPLLADLALDRPTGRKTVGRSHVPLRTQAFATYGLALIGRRAKGEAVRRYVVHELAQAARLGDQPTRDRMVAAIIGLGLVRLDSAPTSGTEPPRVATSREGELTFLYQLWEEPRLDHRVRAYLPVAMARLAAGADPTWKERLVSAFRKALDPRAPAEPLVQHGVLVASGLLGDDDQDPPDQRLRAALVDASSEGRDRLARNLALLALGRSAGRVGHGPKGAGPSETRALLLRALARGSSDQRPWAALALGLLERGRTQAGEPPAEGLRRALLDALQSSKTPSEEGAVATALGLIGERRAIEGLLPRISQGDENLRAQAMIALGLIGAEEAVAPLRESLQRTSSYRAGLLREAAVALALLGDRSAAPLLVQRLERSRKLFEELAVTWSLGVVGDARVVPGLLAILKSRRASETTRAYAAVALGSIASKDRLPWNAPLAADVIWWQAPLTLFDPVGGKGLLDIL